MKGNHLYLTAVTPGTLTIETVTDAVRRRWPGIRLYPRGESGRRELGFFVPVGASEVDCNFFEKGQFVAVDEGEEGAEVLEWVLSIASEDARWVVFTEHETDATPVSSRASARQVLDAVHWPAR